MKQELRTCFADNAISMHTQQTVPCVSYVWHEWSSTAQWQKSSAHFPQPVHTCVIVTENLQHSGVKYKPCLPVQLYGQKTLPLTRGLPYRHRYLRFPRTLA